MNYRHAYHAGNFADLQKHAILLAVLDALMAASPSLSVIDTHAGAGLYDLTGADASRGGEWHDGIERLLAARLAEPVAALLAPYLEVIGALNERGRLKIYPGSPAIARAWLRPQDRLIACELEPKAAAALGRHLRGDSRIKTLAVDGWSALSAYVPPPERRGLVLVDPPFEEDGDFHRLSHGLAGAHRKWATGIFALWYPIKDRGEPDALAVWPLWDASKILSFPYVVARTDRKPEAPDAMKSGIYTLDLATDKIAYKEFENTSVVLFSSTVNPVKRNEAYTVYSTLSRVDTRKGKLLKRVDLEQTFYNVNVSRDGKELYLGGAGPLVAFYDASTLKLLQTIRMPDDSDQATASMRLFSH